MKFGFINIHGLNTQFRGCKLDFPEVRDLICSYDFFGVAETMCSEISFIKFGDYEVISFPATKKAIQGRSSGGFLLLYKKSFSKHTTILKQKHNYCVWFKISTNQQCYFVGLVYIPPQTSNTFEDKFDFEEIFNTIQEEIDLYKQQGFVILLGDWNARVGTLDDQTDLNDDLQLSKPISVDRVITDTKYNTYGFELVQLCLNTGMLLLNGRWGKESQNWTHYYCSGTCTVCDWALTDARLWENIESFKVGKENFFSDHVELGLSIKTTIENRKYCFNDLNQIPFNQVSDCGFGYKINHSKRSHFFQIMDSEFVKQLLLNVKQEIALEGASSKNALQQLTKVLNYISASTFQQKDPPAQDLFPPNESGFLHSYWYDHECKQMHRCLLQHRKKYGIASTIFKETSRTYKRLCRKKKYLFELNKSNELMSLRSKNPKMYWNLLKQGYNSP